MADTEKPDQAPEDIQPAGPIAAPIAAPKARQSLAKSRRELTEEEMTQSGVRLMLLDELDRLDVEVVRLNDYRDKFHGADKRIATLEARHRRNLASEVTHVTCLAVGVGILMLAPTLPSGPIMWSAVAVGMVLTVCGIVAKAMQE